MNILVKQYLHKLSETAHRMHSSALKDVHLCLDDSGGYHDNFEEFLKIIQTFSVQNCNMKYQYLLCFYTESINSAKTVFLILFGDRDNIHTPRPSTSKKKTLSASRQMTYTIFVGKCVHNRATLAFCFSAVFN